MNRTRKESFLEYSLSANPMKCFILSLLLLVTVQLNAIDTLYKQSSFKAQEDSVQIEQLYQEAIKYFHSNIGYSQSVLFKAEEIALQNKSTKDLARIYKGLAYSYIRSHQEQKAFIYLNKSTKEYANLDDNLSLSFICNMKAQAFTNQDKLDSAIYYYNKSEAYLNNYKGDNQHLLRGNYASLYSSMGNLYYFNIEDIPQAKVYYDSALYYAKINNDTVHITASYSNLGIVYLKEKKYKKALENFETAYELSQKINHLVFSINIMNNLGDVYHKMGNNEMSIYCRNKALNLAKEYKVESKIFKATRFLAQGYQFNHDYPSAKRLYLSLLKDTSLVSISQQKNLMWNLSMFYDEIEKYDSALYYYKNFTALNNEIIKLQNFKATEDLLIAHKTEQTKRENQALKLQNQQEKKYSNLIIGLSIVLIILIILLVLYIYQRKKLHAKEQEIVKAENVLLKEKLEFKTKELTINTMNMIRHNEFINSLIPDLRKLNQLDSTKRKQTLLNIIRNINLHNKTQLWEDFNKTFTEVNNSFFESLNQKHPNLTPKDRKLAALLKLDLSTKDIAAITHMSVRGVESARHRLRIKLGLAQDINLSNYFQEF